MPIASTVMQPLINTLGELDLNGINWVRVVGESIPKARPMMMITCKENAIFFTYQENV